jgi:hypothetical protein
VVDQEPPQHPHLIFIFYHQVDVSGSQLDSNAFPREERKVIFIRCHFFVQQVDVLSENPEPTAKASKYDAFDV